MKFDVYKTDPTSMEKSIKHVFLNIVKDFKNTKMFNTNNLEYAVQSEEGNWFFVGKDFAKDPGNHFALSNLIGDQVMRNQKLFISEDEEAKFILAHGAMIERLIDLYDRRGQC